MVDNLEVALFIYLLLNNERIRQVIDTITSKAVLMLGRFTSDRKAVLDAIRDELRQRGYLPILFDFEKPAGRDLTESISTLAHMARFSSPISRRQKASLRSYRPSSRTFRRCQSSRCC
jgi:predicted AAA+ superfamily ATPase